MLGKYFVPTDDDEYAGANEAETRGEGTNGLQGAFEAACRLFAADLEKNYNGLTIDFGYSGYVSKESAERWAEGGNVKFLQYIHYFGYGLAWEFSLIDVGERTKLNAVNAISSYALKYNLSVNVYDSGGFLFVTPRYVQSKDGITASEYGGDADSAEEAEAQGGGASSSSGSLASTAWFFASSFGDTMNAAASQLLVGERALANDEPVWNTVKDIFNSSMRTVMAGPDGTFMAWYPDYWGVSGNTPCLLLDDIELIDLKITQSDDTFVSHQFCAGVNTGGQYLTSSGQTSDMQWALTQGVVSIESNTAALSSGVLNDVGENAISNEPSELLKKLINIPEGEEWRVPPAALERRVVHAARAVPPLRGEARQEAASARHREAERQRDERRDGREPAVHPPVPLRAVRVHAKLGQPVPDELADNVDAEHLARHAREGEELGAFRVRHQRAAQRRPERGPVQHERDARVPAVREGRHSVPRHGLVGEVTCRGT